VSRKKADVTIKFDHHAPTRLLNPAHVDVTLQQKCPVAWSEEHGGFWYVTEYENVKKVGLDWKTFSNCEGVVLPIPPYGKIAMVYDDPPVHTVYRRALNPTLSREAVRTAVQPRIEYWTDVFIDRVIESGRCDLMYDIAVPIPTAVMMEWLGFTDPNADRWWKIGDAWHNIFSRAPGTPRWTEAAEMIAWYDTRISDELNERREAPRDDVLSQIVALEIDGEPIPHEDAVSIVRIMIGAGTDTTTTLLGSAFVHLHYHSEDRERLAGDSELWEGATEEFLRRYNPTRTLFRTCVKETELGGFTIKPGEHVLASLMAANLDDHVFADPLAFDPERAPNRHLGFGIGVHRCVGMHLARAEFIHVMKEVLARLPDYSLLEDELVDYARQGTMTGWITAPATFTPGARKLPASEAAAAVKLAV
jgi:cytochrome P450